MVVVVLVGVLVGLKWWCSSGCDAGVSEIVMYHGSSGCGGGAGRARGSEAVAVVLVVVPLGL